MPENPNMPRKGTAARKIYDCIENSSEGLTAFEVERACGIMKNQQTHIAKLADKGLIQVVGKRDVEGVKNLDIWGIHVEKKAKKKRRRPGFIPKQELDPHECPACGKTINLLLADHQYGGGCIEVNPQRRIIVFDGPWVKHPYTDPDTGEERIDLLPKEPLTLFEEWTGKLVTGRTATDREVEYFAEHKKLRVPWTIGFEGHLSTCKGMKRWLNGKAEKKRRTMEVRWDREKRRFGFFERENRRKSLMKDAFTDAIPEEVVPQPKD